MGSLNRAHMHQMYGKDVIVQSTRQSHPRQLAALLPVRERVLGPVHSDTLTTRHQLDYWTQESGRRGTKRRL